MGIKICVGDHEYTLTEAENDWLAKDVAQRQQSGQRVCVRVDIDVPGVRLLFVTKGCGTSGGSGVPNFNETERRIIDEWQRRRLNVADFEPGQLQAFVKYLRRTLN